MVAADHSSTCNIDGTQIIAGCACGFIIEIPNHNITFYYAGCTGLFGDMKLINDLYQPDVALLPIGDMITMGPRDAAFAAKNFLTNCHTFIPMHFGETMEGLSGTFEEFESQCKEQGLDKKIISARDFFGGKAIVE